MPDGIINIISILAGFIAIWINEILTHKRDIKHKKEELLISHLKEMLEWLNIMQQSLFSISRSLINAINIYRDINKKEQLQKNFNIEANEIIEKSIVFCNSYAEINSSLGIDLELAELNKDIGLYIDKLRAVQKEYLFPSEDDADLKKVNEESAIIIEKIKKRTNIILKEINKLLLI